MPRRPSNPQQYPEILLKPIEYHYFYILKPGQLLGGKRDVDWRLVGPQIEKRIAALFRHFDLGAAEYDDENPWCMLAVRLAQTHVAGFKSTDAKTKRKPGTKEKWRLDRRLQLWADVEAKKDAVCARGREAPSVETICGWFSTGKGGRAAGRWKGTTAKVLSNNYHLASKKINMDGWNIVSPYILKLPSPRFGSLRDYIIRRHAMVVPQSNPYPVSSGGGLLAQFRPTRS